MWSLNPGDQEEPGNAETRERLFRRLGPRSFLPPGSDSFLLPRVLLGLFGCLVSLYCVLWGLFAHFLARSPQVSILSQTTTGHVFQAKQDRGARPVGVADGVPLIRVGQEVLLLSLECPLLCEPLHPQEVAPQT